MSPTRAHEVHFKASIVGIEVRTHKTIEPTLELSVGKKMIRYGFMNHLLRRKCIVYSHLAAWPLGHVGEYFVALGTDLELYVADNRSEFRQAVTLPELWLANDNTCDELLKLLDALDRQHLSVRHEKP